MSSNETATPTPRIAITPTTTPAPPWTGLKETCRQCGAIYQFEAADKFDRHPGSNLYFGPDCTDCGDTLVIEIKVEAETQQEGDAS